MTQQESNGSCHCYICMHPEKIRGKDRVPWTIICKYLLVSLSQLSEKEYYSAHDDIYPFVVEHWDLLSTLKQFSDRKSWKKALLDAMNHSDQFEGGAEKKRVGLWRLKTVTNSIDSEEKKESRVRIELNHSSKKVKGRMEKKPMKVKVESNERKVEGSVEKKKKEQVHHQCLIPVKEEPGYVQLNQSLGCEKVKQCPESIECRQTISNCIQPTNSFGTFPNQTVPHCETSLPLVNLQQEMTSGISGMNMNVPFSSNILYNRYQSINIVNTPIEELQTINPLLFHMSFIEHMNGYWDELALLFEHSSRLLKGQTGHSHVHKSQFNSIQHHLGDVNRIRFNLTEGQHIPSSYIGIQLL